MKRKEQRRNRAEAEILCAALAGVFAVSLIGTAGQSALGITHRDCPEEWQAADAQAADVPLTLVPVWYQALEARYSDAELSAALATFDQAHTPRDKARAKLLRCVATRRAIAPSL